MYVYFKKKKKLKAITKLKCVIEEIQIISQMRVVFFFTFILKLPNTYEGY